MEESQVTVQNRAARAATHQSRHSCPNSSSTTVADGVSPSTPNPPRRSKRERAKDRAAQASKVLQRRVSQAVEVAGVPCGISPSPTGSRSCVLLQTISPPLRNPTPPSALCRLVDVGQLRVGGCLLLTCLLQSCSVMVCTLPTSAPVSSNWGHNGCINGQLCSVVERQSVSHDLDLSVVDSAVWKEIQVGHPHID